MCLLVGLDAFGDLPANLQPVPATNMRHARSQQQNTGHKWFRWDSAELKSCEAIIGAGNKAASSNDVFQDVQRLEKHFQGPFDDMKAVLGEL